VVIRCCGGARYAFGVPETPEPLAYAVPVTDPPFWRGRRLLICMGFPAVFAAGGWLIWVINWQRRVAESPSGIPPGFVPDDYPGVVGFSLALAQVMIGAVLVGTALFGLSLLWDRLRSTRPG
jgi:hypothetical protein